MRFLAWTPEREPAKPGCLLSDYFKQVKVNEIEHVFSMKCAEKADAFIFARLDALGVDVQIESENTR